ncbi:hypothetical protein J661_3415 [Acinetobacter baumannii 1391434]|nr:hypothetical protein J661_3415 [Acinetobacter baumannii 1391434]
MGPWGNLRIKEIDYEKVSAEIGMIVQLLGVWKSQLQSLQLYLE